jgi:SPP1 gp7 family putative phage head morphogenesis protein
MAEIDPSRTTTLRRQYGMDLIGRFVRVARDCQDLIVVDDAFGLGEERLSFNVKREFAFATKDQKMVEFIKWLDQRIAERVLTVSGLESKGIPTWQAKYIHAAYAKGVTKAFKQVKPQNYLVPDPFYQGQQAQFIESSFSAPRSLESVRILATRAFEELKDISRSTATQLNIIFAEGMASGKSPKAIAREITDRISTITKTRALRLARTEIIHAHAEGQLDAFAELGVTTTTALAELQTAGDPCPICFALSGQVFTLAEARGIIPVHPNCRCIWVPYTKDKKKPRSKRAKAALAGLL